MHLRFSHCSSVGDFFEQHLPLRIGECNGIGGSVIYGRHILNFQRSRATTFTDRIFHVFHFITYISSSGCTPTEPATCILIALSFIGSITIFPPSRFISTLLAAASTGIAEPRRHSRNIFFIFIVLNNKLLFRILFDCGISSLCPRLFPRFYYHLASLQSVTFGFHSDCSRLAFLCPYYCERHPLNALRCGD